MKMTRRIAIGIVSSALLLVGATAAFAAEIQIPAREGTPGDTVEVPVMIDETDNLAGIKLVMTYDAGTLLFKKAEKTQHTAPLMHIVNDKKPGVLIAVMAGARGIKGKAFALLTLTFQVRPDAKAPGESPFNITEVQLMSDQLKDIKATVKAEPLKIVAASPSEPIAQSPPKATCTETPPSLPEPPKP
jgi:hypothetical protein